MSAVDARGVIAAVITACIGLGAAIGLGACSAPANLPDLAEAEAREKAGDDDQALLHYRQAQTTCRQLRTPRRRRELCAMALIGEAEILERQGKTRQAIAAYAAIPQKAEGDPPPSAQGLYRAGVLSLDVDDDTAAWTYLWKVVTDYPDEAFAGDAVGVLLRDGRRRDARALGAELGRIGTALGAAEVVDNILWALADLSEHELNDLAAARSLYDRIPLDFPKSGLRDDARWHGARVSLALGDAPGAVTRLRALLATREVAAIGGSYFSVWLDDAQLRLGVILRDQLHDRPGAIAAFRRLPRDYPDSILRDDASIELAETLAAGGDRKGACAELGNLGKRYPESKFLATRGPALAARIDCPAAAPATPPAAAPAQAQATAPAPSPATAPAPAAAARAETP